VYDESDGTYGAPRVHAELADHGRRHGRKRIARLMRCAGCRGRAPKRWRTTTVPDPPVALPADLIGRDFATATASLNARWCGDITCIHTWEGWLYLATVIDLTSRRVVGWGHRRPPPHRPDRPSLGQRGVQPAPDPWADLPLRPRLPNTPAPSSGVWPTSTESGSRSADAVNAGTTRWPSHSSRPSRPSCSIDVPGRPGPPPTSDLQLDRGLVQHPATTLHTGPPQPGRLRGQAHPTTRTRPSSLTPHRPCPSERVNPKSA
jgi:hypothetical protein